MFLDFHEMLGLLRSKGQDAALPVLNAGLAAMPSPSVMDDIERLSMWARYCTLARAWVLAGPVWVRLIQELRGRGEDETRAYYFNDLGAFLLEVGDDRCFGCFQNALHLTRMPGRRMRTLGRLGIAWTAIRRDHDRARKFFKAAIVVGDKAGANPLHVEESRMLTTELALDKEGHSDEFAERRRAMVEGQKKFAVLLRQLEVPPL